ncbi:hypothetical protein PC9H_000324 [Pleurotus ostreatus]|uniref:SCD domain-containing protein n=1 Tax=Pleurotus ostreatus TaxID=5322 RepID=A0A8H7DWI6_PLEOS|nr:uncharacterized protein PC9H_000324 [Pleurotus ostreatus]KAF7439987.1 hypothetical protein PC9H_000324 [Pleurotus ostreatus]KAJ8700803.1 cohesin complex subunit [Pleurotus ostreatus]
MAEDSPAPRRSQRERKLAQHFTSVDSALSKGKRKRDDSETEDEGLDERDVHASEDEGDDEDDEPGPKSKRKPRRSKTKSPVKPKGPPPAKKPRAAKQPAPKSDKPATRRGRKPKNATTGAFNAAEVAKDTKISDDNPLFNAIMNPSAALQSTAEDLLQTLTETPGAAQAELVNLILRACGCNDSVDADEALDYDGVVDALDNFTELLKQDNSPVYPLTSKLPIFKKFRKSLSEFLGRLISSSASLGHLYTTDLMPTLQTWVIAMSSSQIRSFRHTATVVALEVETALCEVAAKVEKEAEVIGRQREGEKKRKANNKGTGAKDKQLEGKAAEVRERRTKVAEYLKEFVDGVFVHRYRDLDPNIRAECVHAIGLWFKKFPAHYLDGSYLRYVGWVLSDSTTQVRLEAVRALIGVYEQTDYIGSLNHFTERFKPRLVEMATSDTELSVRVAVIQVLESMDDNSLLEDEEREKLCLLIYDQEPKIRRAVSGFVKSMWDETAEERLVGRSKSSKNDKARAGVKALAMLLVKWGSVIDRSPGGLDDGEGDSEDTANAQAGRKELTALAVADSTGRVALAVEALWDELEPVSDWEGLLDVLLLDHSATGEDNSQTSHGGRADGTADGSEASVDEAWRLDDVEEGILLEVLVAALQRAKRVAAGGKKGEEETVTNDITRALIKGLPRLFIKHQTDSKRIAAVLLIPQLMNLDLYLEMRMIAGYASLWDDVTKQFLSHSSLPVLTHAVSTILTFLAATSLSNTNSTKILELEDELSSLLRDAVAGRDEIEVTSFSEDEVLSLGALCTRLAVLSGNRDLTAWTEEDEGGKQSSVWDIISAISERGRLGYKEEETMVKQALRFLSFHIIWKAKELPTSAEPSPDEIQYKDKLSAQRESLLEKLTEYAIGTQSNTVESVKREAFQHLLNLHVLFSSSLTVDAEGLPLPTASLPLTLEDEIQYRCAGFVQAEIERYADIYAEHRPREDEESSSERSDDDQADPKEPSKQKRVASESKEPAAVSRSLLEQEYAFIDVMSTFLRAIRAGAIHVRHGATLLAHYGRLGPSFDICSRTIVDVLREEGMVKGNGDLVATVIIQALQEAFTLVLEGVVREETNAVALAKLLLSCFVIRGSQLSIVRRLDGQYVVQVHSTLLTWITKRIAVYESNKNKNGLRSSITFFRVLLPLLGVIESRDALKIKAHMDQALAQAKLEASPSARLWEPQRAYEKRLSTAMSKDKAPGPKGRRRKAANKGKESATSDEGETEPEKAPDDHDHNESETHQSPVLPTGHPEPPEESPRADGDHGPTTPRARPRLRTTARDPTSPLSDFDEMTTPVSRKRPRSEHGSGSETESITNPVDDEHSALPPHDPPTPPAEELRIKKRVRH